MNRFRATITEGGKVKLAPPLEHDIQSAFFEWVSLVRKVHLVLRLMFAVPNGGLRDIRVAKRLKDEGVIAGVPDVMLPASRHQFIGLAIEFKRPGEVPSKKQSDYSQLLINEGWMYVVVTDSEAAIRTVKQYLSI